MTNQEKKQELWESLSPKYKHLESYCKIEVIGIEDDDIYFHPTFIINEEVYISCQGDVGNKYLYAFKFTLQKESETFITDIHDELLSSIILGYYTNKEVVMLALETLIKMRKHMSQLSEYTLNYIQDVLVGNSVNEVTNQFIQELKTVNSLVSFMQKQKELK